MNFFDPTSRYKEMALLEHIEKYEQTTQKEMSNKIEASLSMVNTYLDKLESNNLIVREYKSTKVVHYHITPEGIKRKNYLQITYIKELMEQYIKGQASVSHFLESVSKKNIKKVILYGAGEVAEIILDIINANNYDIEVLCIIDDDVEKQDTYLRDIHVCKIDALSKLKHDGVIITSYKFEEEILDKIIETGYPRKHIIRYFNVKDS